MQNKTKKPTKKAHKNKTAMNNHGKSRQSKQIVTIDNTLAVIVIVIVGAALFLANYHDSPDKHAQKPSSFNLNSVSACAGIGCLGYRWSSNKSNSGCFRDYPFNTEKAPYGCCTVARKSLETEGVACCTPNSDKSDCVVCGNIDCVQYRWDSGKPGCYKDYPDNSIMAPPECCTVPENTKYSGAKCCSLNRDKTGCIRCDGFDCSDYQWDFDFSNPGCFKDFPNNKDPAPAECCVAAPGLISKKGTLCCAPNKDRTTCAKCENDCSEYRWNFDFSNPGCFKDFPKNQEPAPDGCCIVPPDYLLTSGVKCCKPSKDNVKCAE